jgi:hypothetical protein
VLAYVICNINTLTPQKEERLRVTKNRMLRIISGPKTEEIPRG